MKLVTIIGARPQFIKAGSLSREIDKLNKRGVFIDEVIVNTGQHYDSNMSSVFFEEMHIPQPKYNLGVGGGSHGEMTGQMIEKIEKVLIKESPDWVIVYGDTNSTLAAAITASKLNIKLAHIEAGLRSFNMKMPEEVNRIITDRLSTLLFCPTLQSMENIDREGLSHWENGARTVLCGDIMQDGALFYANLAKKINEDISDGYILCTIHRAENTDDIQKLSSIFRALNEISKQRKVIFPLHPRTKKLIESNNIDISNITIIEPVGYLNMIWLIKNSDLIMTDSGGLQKEAFFFSKPCITIREETEWVELINAGVNVLAGTDENSILDKYKNTKFNFASFGKDLYGSGMAGSKILTTLLEFD